MKKRIILSTILLICILFTMMSCAASTSSDEVQSPFTKEYYNLTIYFNDGTKIEYNDIRPRPVDVSCKALNTKIIFVDVDEKEHTVSIPDRVVVDFMKK